jgi:uncharacterized protein YbaP (TraB family)
MLRFMRFLWLVPLVGLVAEPALSKPTLPRETARGIQDYEPRPALWLLEDEDTKIYLFGTFHILPPGFKWRSAAVNGAIAAADELVVETAVEPGGEEDSRALAMMLLDEPSPILKRVPAARRKQLERAIRAGDLPIEFYDSMRSWAAGMMLGMAQMLGNYGAEDAGDAPGVEDVLERLFREADKPVLGVEDGDAVLEAMNRLPEAVQIELLLSGLDELPAAGKGPSEDDHRWAKGDYEALALDDPKLFPPLLFDLLVRKRNAAWTQWLTERLEQPGTVLFAVGAGHLAGRESVQAMLAERGLAVTRVN